MNDCRFRFGGNTEFGLQAGSGISIDDLRLTNERLDQDTDLRGSTNQVRILIRHIRVQSPSIDEWNDKI